MITVVEFVELIRGKVLVYRVVRGGGGGGGLSDKCTYMYAHLYILL